MRLYTPKFALPVLCVVVALVVATAFADSPRKKCISFGWEYGRLTPEQILANADKFKGTVVDGVGIYLRATNRAGKAIGTYGFMTNPEWDIEAFAAQIPALRKIAHTEHLSESFLKCFSAPTKRVPWTDDAAWARIAHNMGVVGRLSRETGLKGINSDTEDYHKQKQYERVKDDPPYDELVKIVRRRGREVFGALFREQPEARVLFYWFLTFRTAYFDTPDPLALAKRKGDLWPAFADGIMDVLPPTARIIDGDEHAYSYLYDRHDYHVSACNQRMFAPLLLSPENRAKHAAQVQVSFGIYLDMYINPGPVWYKGPVCDSRLEHFRRDCADAFKLADEYVWLWGEKHPTIHWENVTTSPSVKSKETWAEVLPGLYEAMRARDDATFLFRQRKDDLAAKGQLKDMIENPECRPDDQSAMGKLPRPYTTYAGKGNPVFRLAEGVGDGDTSCIAVSGLKDGAILVNLGKANAQEMFAVSCRMKGTMPKAYVGWKDADGKWAWHLGTKWLEFSSPDGSGWQTGEAFVEVPEGAKGFSLGFCPEMEDGETVFIDNVHVWKLW